ncbi:phosphotriesterase family protein [Antrihabitans stalactiti]|uniref:Phosphotriesterase n=1 Tax=Antrihabitans stalactiti TaxID=2584121 RepID=A0A848KD70_9NOCA|nr:phosphotriesterase [Antrihabitans stalactiti]NMN96259.1 phosphotriesterase [Antrihabitans stalactiti]
MTTTSTVETVRGPVATDTLGKTLMHEHVFVLTPDSQANWNTDWDEQARVADAVERLHALAATGISTIVDPTVDGLGRYLPRIKGIADQVPELNILVATGIYTYTDAPHYFEYRLGDPDPMTGLFVRDIREGIQGTGVKAALLKCAIDDKGLTAGVERVMRAVAQTNRETGTPIMVHTHPGSKTGLEVRRVLESEGVDSSRVQLAHSGDSTDADHLAELAEAGYLLGMDRFGIDIILPFEQRIDIVVEMCRRGYAASMVLSQDASCHIDWAAPEMLALLPNWTYFHVLRDVVPTLLERGVSDADIEAMLVGNPRRWFEG